jgi:carbon storage regulator
MLVLSRKQGERVVLAESIVVTVLKVERGCVRLGIAAPEDVRVLRQELQGRPPSGRAAPQPVEARS